MPKTINYELAKKLYDTGVIIPSKKFKKKKWSIRWTDIYWNEIKFPAPNIEEVIDFLNTLSLVFDRPNNYTRKMYNFVITLCQDCWYVVSCQFENNFLFEVDWKNLIEAIEATLEYLLANWYIWNKN